MRILFLSTLAPGALSSGSEVATQAFVDGLRALGHDVAVVAYRRTGSRPPTHPGDVVVADRHIETDGAGLRPVLWMARALLTRRPYSAAKYVTRGYARAVAEQVRRDPALVVVDHAQMGWAVPRSFRGPVVYVAHNVEHRLYRELAAAGGIRARASRREAALIRRAEGALCRDARAVWALTADDAGALAALGAGARASHFDLPAAKDPPPPAGEPGFDVGILGSWTWQPNAAGLEWFLRAVRPLLPESIGVEVAGRGSEQAVAGAAGVTARGRVPDAMAFLQAARVVAVPGVAGAGVQVKTLDAIASGRCVVATETAMRGIADPPATVRVVHDGDAETFAEALRDVARAGGGEDAAAAAREWGRARRARFLEQLRASVDGLA